VYGLIADRRMGLPGGRLDLDTSGLLLMTNDTQLAELGSRTRPTKVPKTYLVKAATRLAAKNNSRSSGGGVVSATAGPSPLLSPGLRESGARRSSRSRSRERPNRQVRRVVTAMGSKRLKLVRDEVGPLTIGDLEIGKYRRLTRGGGENAEPLQRQAAGPSGQSRFPGLPASQAT